MSSRKRRVDPVPETFATYEEAAEFWDTHDTADYVELLEPVEVDAELQTRHHEVEVDEDVAELLRDRARAAGVSVRRLASDLLRRQMLPGT